MDDLIPGPNTKTMYMRPGDHRIYCEEHKPDHPGTYEVEMGLGANCWACLRQLKEVKA